MPPPAAVNYIIEPANLEAKIDQANCCGSGGTHGVRYGLLSSLLASSSLEICCLAASHFNSRPNPMHRLAKMQLAVLIYPPSISPTSFLRFSQASHRSFICQPIAE